MSTLNCTSLDGTRIAYDVAGAGPALILLHGTGRTRIDWHVLGYVSGLMGQYQVITLDLRGSGESDRPIDISAYEIDKLCGDVTAVADRCGISQFALCGYSFGGNVARYLAARSDRVNALVVIGVPFGPAVHTSFARKIDELVRQWAQTPDRNHHRAREAMAEQFVEGVKESEIPIWLACFQAMRSYPVVQPGDIHCPALILVGSENEEAVNWIKSHQTTLRNAGTHVEIIEGLDHSGEFTGVDRVFPAIRSFLQTVSESKAAA